jgi:hypothetical protein
MEIADGSEEFIEQEKTELKGIDHNIPVVGLFLIPGAIKQFVADYRGDGTDKKSFPRRPMPFLRKRRRSWRKNERQLWLVRKV